VQSDEPGSFVLISLHTHSPCFVLMLADLQIPAQPPAESRPVTAPSFDQQFDDARKLVSDGQLAMALAAYDGLLARAPGNVDVLLSRGIVYGRLQRWDKAQADLNAAAAAAPNYADVWSALGNVYLWSGQPDKAADAYTHLVALRPGDADAQLSLGRALRASGDSNGARSAFDKARALGAVVPVAAEAPAVAMAAAPDAFAMAGYHWASGLSTSWTDPGTGPRWNDQTISVRHYGKQGSIGFETLRAHRFGEQDYAWALDAYTGLWQGAYANLRYQRSPVARLFPRNSGRAEVYQSLGHGWEVSLSDDVLAFPATRVSIYGASVGKYVGNYYIALRHQNIVSPGSHSNGDRLLARFYYEGEADTYLELTANRGRSDDAASLVGGRAHSGGAGLAWVRYWNKAWGGRVGASLSRSGDANERAVSFSVYRRW
jgi:YaiO family outer membrane protein